MPQLNFLAKINDYGIHQDDMRQIFFQWQHPMAYGVAPDLPYWATRLASHHCIVMAIKMASEGRTFVLIVVAK
jgi:hypothetical protein